MRHHKPLVFEVDSPMEALKMLATHAWVTDTAELSRVAVAPAIYGSIRNKSIALAQGNSVEITIDSSLSRNTVAVESNRDRWTAKIEKKG